MGSQYKLIFNVPQHGPTSCKAAIFSAGVGRYQNYAECCFTVMGTGQFRPTNDANPHIGSVGTLEETQEARVEALCLSKEIAGKAVEALKSAHPYEEPSYHVYKLEDF